MSWMWAPRGPRALRVLPAVWHCQVRPWQRAEDGTKVFTKPVRIRTYRRAVWCLPVPVSMYVGP